MLTILLISNSGLIISNSIKKGFIIAWSTLLIWFYWFNNVNLGVKAINIFSLDSDKET